MKVVHVTVRANVAWGEYQHVRIEARMEPQSSDRNLTKRELRKEAIEFVDLLLAGLVSKLRKEPAPAEPADDTNPDLMPE